MKKTKEFIQIIYKPITKTKMVDEHKEEKIIYFNENENDYMKKLENSIVSMCS